MELEKIEVPLDWVELDSIILALRLVNKVYKDSLHSPLEEKLCKYSSEAKSLQVKRNQENHQKEIKSLLNK